MKRIASANVRTDMVPSIIILTNCMFRRRICIAFVLLVFSVVSQVQVEEHKSTVNKTHKK